MLRVVIISLLVFTQFPVFAQDSTAIESLSDSLFTVEDDQYKPPLLVQGSVDSTLVNQRSFEEEKVAVLKADDDLQYKEPPTYGESLWERFLRFLVEFFDDLINSAVETEWGQVFSYLVGVAVFIVIIMMILRVDAFKMLYTNESAATMKYNVFDEDIHTLDFDTEIQNALNQKDYRRGVRLLFLYALKILSDRNYIDWEQGKTNHEYVAEVKEETLRRWLHQLSFYFDYAWYGNFAISREMFDKVNGIFRDWQGKMR